VKALLASAVLLAGCAGRAPVSIPSLDSASPASHRASVDARDKPEAPRAPRATRIVEDLANGASRPRVITRIRRNAARIPLASWSDPDERSWIRLIGASPRFIINDVSFGKLAIGDIFGGFTGENFRRGEWPACPDKRARQWSQWVGFNRDKWTDAGVDVMMSRGDFDFETCKAQPEATLRARAAALVNGWVYALRVDDGETRSLFILAPSAVLASATEDAAESGPFSVVTLPLGPGHDAAAVLRVAAGALPDWRNMRASGRESRAREPTTPSPLLLTIEVAAKAGADPDVTIVASLAGGANRRDYAALLDAMAE
jgi:hypothetical protein